MNIQRTATTVCLSIFRHILFFNRARIGLPFLLLLLQFVAPVTANSNRYNPFLYDRTVPTFTPDGRLLQLEYATNCVPQQSQPMLLLSLNEHVSVLVAVSSSTTSSIQERLTVLHDTNIVVGWSGLRPDALHVQEQLHNALLDQQIQYGSKKRHTAWSIANEIANICLQNAMGGGLRPLGVSCWVLEGSSNGNGDNHPNSFVLYQTDPTGAMQTFDKRAVAVQVLGVGSSALQRTLEGRASSWQSSPTPLASALTSIVDVLQQQRQRHSSNNNHNKIHLEVVLLSKRAQPRGVYKLSVEQVERLLASSSLET